MYITYQDGADTVRKKLGKFPIFFPKLEFCARNNDYSKITLNNLEYYEKVTIESITHSTNTGKTIKIYGVTDADGHELIFTETPPSDTNIELDIKQYKGIFLEFSGWSGETSLSQSFVTNIYIN